MSFQTSSPPLIVTTPYATSSPRWRRLCREPLPHGHQGLDLWCLAKKVYREVKTTFCVFFFSGLFFCFWILGFPDNFCSILSLLNTKPIKMKFFGFKFWAILASCSLKPRNGYSLGVASLSEPPLGHFAFL